METNWNVQASDKSTDKYLATNMGWTSDSKGCPLEEGPAFRASPAQVQMTKMFCPSKSCSMLNTSLDLVTAQEDQVTAYDMKWASLPTYKAHAESLENNILHLLQWNLVGTQEKDHKRLSTCTEHHDISVGSGPQPW